MVMSANEDGVWALEEPRGVDENLESLLEALKILDCLSRTGARWRSRQWLMASVVHGQLHMSAQSIHYPASGICRVERHSALSAARSETALGSADPGDTEEPS